MSVTTFCKWWYGWHPEKNQLVDKYWSVNSGLPRGHCCLLSQLQWELCLIFLEPPLRDSTADPFAWLLRPITARSSLFFLQNPEMQISFQLLLLLSVLCRPHCGDYGTWTVVRQWVTGASMTKPAGKVLLILTIKQPTFFLSFHQWMWKKHSEFILAPCVWVCAYICYHLHVCWNGSSYLESTIWCQDHLSPVRVLSLSHLILLFARLALLHWEVFI